MSICLQTPEKEPAMIISEELQYIDKLGAIICNSCTLEIINYNYYYFIFFMKKAGEKLFYAQSQEHWFSGLT